ncbi:MAG: hypothetical protein JWP06_648 [Candidatus Saccharibacteria bacterium]|nr:hypothetical protein [Candidatus Saccharibacteria bacterium]
MEHRANNEKNAPLKVSKLNLLVAIGVVAVLACVIAAFLFLTQPERSAANFCNVAKEQKPTLTSDVDYQKRLDSYKKLESVSPDDIRPDITTIRKGYEVIVQDPSKTLSAGFGMSGAEGRRTAYINSNCKDF